MSVFKKAETVKFLFLPGVHLEDIVSLDKLWKAEVHEPAPTKKKQWTVLPKFFYGLNGWVKRCNLICCSCGYSYNTIPVCMPIRMVKDDGKVGFEIAYNYCGFLCVAKAIGKIPDISTKAQRNAMLRIMFEYYYGIKPAVIPCAPDIEEREDRGGQLSDVEFKRTINKNLTSILEIVIDQLDVKTFLLDT